MACRRVTSLRQLLLDGNAFVDASSCSGARPLRLLSLENNKLQQFVTDRSLYLLESLNLKHNMLTEIDAVELTSMPFLFALDIADNSLTALPNVLDRLTLLTHIDASHNRISQLECSFAPLTNLTYVDLSHNAIESSNMDFSEAGDLTYINVWKCR